MQQGNDTVLSFAGQLARGPKAFEGAFSSPVPAVHENSTLEDPLTLDHVPKTWELRAKKRESEVELPDGLFDLALLSQTFLNTSLDEKLSGAAIINMGKAAVKNNGAAISLVPLFQ